MLVTVVSDGVHLSDSVRKLGDLLYCRGTQLFLCSGTRSENYVHLFGCFSYSKRFTHCRIPVTNSAKSLRNKRYVKFYCDILHCPSSPFYVKNTQCFTHWTYPSSGEDRRQGWSNPIQSAPVMHTTHHIVHPSFLPSPDNRDASSLWYVVCFITNNQDEEQSPKNS